MAAEAAAQTGVAVDLYDAMPSLGRKLLLAGKSGLNLTHSEAYPTLVNRYGNRAALLEPYLTDFAGEAVRAWAASLGIETFVGSSGRVFPIEMKAAPLLRAWLRRLRALGVCIHVRHRWQGWAEDGALLFDTPTGRHHINVDAVVLALGGGSWARLGSDGAWLPWLRARQIPVEPLRPANCGFDTEWTPHFAERHAGRPVKPVIASVHDSQGKRQSRQGEFVVTARGVEGSLIYSLSAALRAQLDSEKQATLILDLAPGRTLEQITSALQQPRGSRSLAYQLKRVAAIDGVKAGLLRERLTASEMAQPDRLAHAIKALPLRLTATRPLDEAISSAGGVAFTGMDESLMLRPMPGVFCCGEMLDWEAPTGGYLLTACLATGRAAGLAAAGWLTRTPPPGGNSKLKQDRQNCRTEAAPPVLNRPKA